MSVSSDYPPYVEPWECCANSSQLAVIDNEVSVRETEASLLGAEAFPPTEESVQISTDEPDTTSAPSDASSGGCRAELLDSLGELPASVVAPSFAASSASSNAEFLDLLGDLPESMVDDDETIDNVRKGLADAGAVLRLDECTFRRFSATGDKYIV